MCPERVNNKDTIGWNKRRKTKILVSKSMQYFIEEEFKKIIIFYQKLKKE